MESIQPRSFYPGYSGLKAWESRATHDELLSICLRNCSNSFMVLALVAESHRGIALADAQPSIERFEMNVEILYAHVLNEWKNEKLSEAWKATKLEDVHTYFFLYHLIIELLNTRGLLSPSKVPRTLVE